MRNIIKQKIISTKDQTLKTRLTSINLIEGEVTEIEFINENELIKFIGIGAIKLVPNTTEIKKEIPIILHDSEHNVISLSNVSEKLKINRGKVEITE